MCLSRIKMMEYETPENYGLKQYISKSKLCHCSEVFYNHLAEITCRRDEYSLEHNVLL